MTSKTAAHHFCGPQVLLGITWATSTLTTSSASIQRDRRRGPPWEDTLRHLHSMRLSVPVRCRSLRSSRRFVRKSFPVVFGRECRTRRTCQQACQRRQQIAGAIERLSALGVYRKRGSQSRLLAILAGSLKLVRMPFRQMLLRCATRGLNKQCADVA
jgi:hypothetical protein